MQSKAEGRIKVRMDRGRKSATVAALLVFVIVCAAVLPGCGTSSSNTANTAPPDSPYIARLSVVGEIGSVSDDYTSSDDSYHHDWTMKIIDDLIAGDNNRGILLFVNSPGGSVYESDELYLKLMEYKEKTERPIYVYMGAMAASGGYYIAAGADKIYANRNTWTGSIGVISGTYFDVSGFLKKHGITATDIISGRNKGMGGYFEAMTDEQRAIMQSIVDEAYEQFTDIVATGRGISLDKIKEIADGRVYTAKQALANGLIDGVMTEKEAIEQVKESLGDKDMPVSDIRFAPSSDIFGFGNTDLFSLFGLLGGDRKEGAGTGGLGVSGTGYGTGGSGTGSYGGYGAGGYGAGSGAGQPVSGTDASGLSQGDIARVLDLATSSGHVPLKYLYQG